MANGIPEEFQDLLERKTFGHLATLMPDGTPHVTPVWVDYDGEYVLVNSIKGRQKDRNISRRREVALSIQDPENPYRYLAVRGEVAEIEEEGAVDHIHQLAQKYLGREEFPALEPRHVRRIYKIDPQHVMRQAG